MNKPYDVGFICGRFQTFHKGHEKLVETGLMLCDRLLIFIGSSQEDGTERNPFNITTREKMLKEIYGGRGDIMIYGLPDLTTENDITPAWGSYLLDKIDRYIYKKPDIMIYGNDESRSAWFSKEDLKGMTELIINRSDLPISATMVRDYMVHDQRKEWMQLVNPKLHKMYDELRMQLMSVEYYKNRLSEKCDMSKTCGFKYDEYWVKANHYEKINPSVNKWLYKQEQGYIQSMQDVTLKEIAEERIQEFTTALKKYII